MDLCFMENSSGASSRIFQPNRSKKNIAIIYVVCGFFILLGLLLIAGDNSKGYFLSGFAFVLLLIGHFATTPAMVSYEISNNKISLRRWKKTIELSYPEIESIVELKAEQAEAFMLKRWQKMEDNLLARPKEDAPRGTLIAVIKLFRDAIKLQSAQYSPYKILSVPIQLSQRRYGGPELTEGVKIPCSTVFILLKNGEGHLISPRDTEGFVNEAQKYFDKSRR